MPAKNTCGSASISAAVPGSKRTTPSLMERNPGIGAATYSNKATGSWLDSWRSRSSEARKANSAWRRRVVSPWRRRQDQKAKAVITAKVMPISIIAESVNCRDDATVMSVAAWASDTGGETPETGPGAIIDRGRTREPRMRHSASADCCTARFGLRHAMDMN